MINRKYPINIFKSNFLMKGNLNKLEPKILSKWKKKNYSIKNKNKIFILHDGPPYANGSVHLGHILNKILKDIIIKFNNIYGKKVNYTLGWDCYGTPIELKIEKLIKVNSHLEKLCKFYVINNINNQKKDFIKLGIIFNKYYYTMNNNNISEEIKILNNFYKKKFIEQKLKPVYWCFNCKSSLSESEVIYKLKIDLSINIIFLYLNLLKLINRFKLKKLYILGGILIWTTTPWTILSNQYLCVNKEFYYILINTLKGNLIINYKSFLKIKDNLYKYYIINITLGKNLLNIEFLNPIFKINKFFNRSTIIIKNKNVSNIGTGILHVSPACGIEDFILYNIYNKKKNKNILNLISSNGFYFDNIPFFKNFKINSSIKLVLKNLIINNKKILYKKYQHKYMFCWRHKDPIFYRITLQWFLKINFKNFFLKKVEKVKFFPKIFKNRFISTFIKRNDWNISRQKSWGIPIPFIKHKKHYYLNNFIDNFLNFIPNYANIYGIKVWNILNLKDIIKNYEIFYKKTYNILDIWLDSGLSHWYVLRNNNLFFPSDICVEGSDQHRGWFQASLTTSLILNKKNPYKNILTHGFVLNNKKEKLSKSLKNFFILNEFIKIIDIDILRLWISNINFTKDIIFSENIIKQIIFIYKKLRNTIKFFLSNLPVEYKNIKYIKLFKLNKYFISYCNIIYKNLINNYKLYNFKKIIFFLKTFLNKDLNNLYFNLIKNIVYIDIINSKKKKNIEFILYIFIKNFLKIIFPIISFTIQESWEKIFYKKIIINKKIYLYSNKKKYFYFWYIIKKINFFYKDFFDFLILKINFIKSYDLKLTLFLNFFYYKKFLKIKNYLNFLFFISKIKLVLKKKNFFFIKIIKKKKCLRCWYKIIKRKNENKNICKLCFIKLFKQNIKY